jgi:hypothetical protein
MTRAVSLHPVTIIFTLVVMAGLFGIFGALIAVPVASALKIIYDEWYYPLMHEGQQPLCPPTPQEEMVRVTQTQRQQDGEQPQAWFRRLLGHGRPGPEENQAT